MRASSRHRPHVAWLAALALATSLVGCSKDSAKPSTTTTAKVTLKDPQPRPASSPQKAVEAVLGAEQKRDRAASFVLLARASRSEFTDVADWTRRRTQLPDITSFDVASSTTKVDAGEQVVATVHHNPGLDPFLGLSLATERQTWTAVRDGEGWLVVAEPDVAPVLPPDAGAADTTRSWVQALQACDQPKAQGLQAVTTLLGDVTFASGVCGASGAVAVGAVGPLPAGPAVADIVAQYSSDALEWGRVVAVTGPKAFQVTLAPIGDQWRIIGVLEGRIATP